MSDEPLVWPERPTCHDGNWQAQQHQALNTGWRDARGRVQDDEHPDSDPYSPTWRTCWYCGSIHPEDLYNLLIGPAPVLVGGSDWKYGWPHKFYIDGIPNPVAGEPVVTYSYGGADDEGNPLPSPRPYGEPRPAPETQRAKFYNEHMLDVYVASPETFEVFADLMAERSGVRFSVEEVDGKPVLKYAAPYRGYQRSSMG